MKRKPRTKVPLADRLVAEAKKHSSVPELQLEYLRWLRDVNSRGNLKAQLACATAIDKIKGYY